FKKAFGQVLAFTRHPKNRNPQMESVPSTGESYRRRMRRIVLSLIHTPDEYLGWLPFAVSAAVSKIRKWKAEWIISTGPPFTAHLVALLAKQVCGVKWIADFRDPWSWNQDFNLPRSGVSDRINRRLEYWVMKQADRVVCVTPAMSEHYQTLYPDLSRNKWVTIS